ncbi:MAG: restriction endonuclease subunit S [Sphaerochaetaceae bacterium]
MGLTKYPIGQLVEPLNIKCGIPKCDWVSGVNIYKRFMPSRNIGTDTSNYLIVPSGAFAFNLMHVGRDGKIPVAINDTDSDIVVSSAYFVFRVINESVLLKEYLYIQMTSPEFDRYVAYCTDASVRDGLDWIRFCEIEINLPPLPIQQKFVAVYNAMLANQQAYENGLNDLKLTCDAYVERLRHEMPQEAIGQYIQQSDERNGLGLGVEQVRGLAVSKAMIETKANMAGVSLSRYKIVPPNYIAYVPDTSRRGDKISLGFNNTDKTFLVSSISTVFGTNMNKLLPEYLMLFFTRSEFDRYARFHSWGSARETFNWDDMCEVKIPIPDINVQRSIVNIYNAYIDRSDINERLKAQIKDLCPILIKGALQEGLSN